jgi:hypothetical protein
VYVTVTDNTKQAVHVWSVTDVITSSYYHPNINSVAHLKHYFKQTTRSVRNNVSWLRRPRMASLACSCCSFKGVLNV